MKFRTRLLIAFGVVVMVPLLVFGLGIRTAMSRRVAAEYEGRINSLVGVIRADLAREEDRISARLRAVKDRMVADNRLRSAVLRGDDRGYILDYAGDAMRLAGLDFLQIQNGERRVVSSGHFRNEFDRFGAFATPGGVTLIRAATAEGSFLVIARPDTVHVAGQAFGLVGGIAADSAYLARLAPDPDFGVAVLVPSDSTAASSSDSAARVVVQLPYVNAVDEPNRIQPAHIVVTHNSGLLAALEQNVNLWFGVAILVAALAALLLASWLSTRISEPVEARIAVGDIARQVTHDIKNGLSPLRNVFRHLSQVARDKPGELPQVFAERQGTVESSISYLETLAANYAKLSPQPERKATDVNTVVRETVGASSAPPIRTKLAEGLPPVSADALVLRRVIENLLSNAVDSLDGKGGTVTVTTERGNGLVRVAVSDTGRGMSKAELDRAFNDFYTTKLGGTGLGLSIVRRLVLDSNGSLQVESEPGKGSKFIVEIPILS